MDQSLIVQPTDISLLNSSRYTLTFPRLPFLRFFVYTTNLPGVSTNPAQVPSPFSEMYRHGDKLVYENLNVTMVNDENLGSWLQIFDWMQGLTFPHKFDEYLLSNSLNKNDFTKGLYADAILTIKSNAYTPILRVHFKHCHPTYLSGIQFSNGDNAELTSYYDATFQFDTYEYEKL